MRHSQGYMLVLTSSGLFYSWDLKAMKVTMTGISIAAILNNYEIGGKIVVSPVVRGLEINPKDGSPLVLLDMTNDIYGYSIDLQCWVKTVDSWYYGVGADKDLDVVLTGLVKKLKMSYEEDKVTEKIFTYKFDSSNDLEDAMRKRGQELLDLI